jgi:hypothetical protein
VEAACSFKTSVSTSAMKCQIPEEYILKNHHCVTTEDSRYIYMLRGIKILTAEQEMMRNQVYYCCSFWGLPIICILKKNYKQKFKINNYLITFQNLSLYFVQ